MGPEVFISYPSKEKQAADVVCSELEAGDLTCWIAPRDIPPGGDWAESIMAGLADCRLLVVVISKNTGDSRHVLREVERAVNRGVPLLPVRIDETIPDGNLGYFLGTSHWFEAQGGKVGEVADSLRKAAQDLIDGAGDPSPRPAPGPISGISRRAFVAGAVALVLIAAIMGWLLLGGQSEDGNGGATGSVRLAGDATALVAGMSESTEDLTGAVRRGRPTADLAAEFQEANSEAARIAGDAEGDLAESGTSMENAADNLEAIADNSAVPGLDEARSARDQMAAALASLEQALTDLKRDLTAQGSHGAADSITATLSQLRSNRKALLGPYTALIREL